jgi:hypothetical protein
MIKSKTKEKTKSAQIKSIPTSKKKYWLDLLYIFILMLVVIRVYNKVYDKKLFLGGDNAVYYITAKAIASGEGYTNINTPSNSPATWYPPGYPFISAGIMSVFGKKIEVMNIANGFFLFGSLIFLYLISIRFTKNKHLSIVIAIISALNMHILNYSFIAMSEIPFLFTSLGAIYFFMLMKKQSFSFKDINFWVCVFFLMFSYYIRAMGIVLIGGVIFYLLFERKWKIACVIFAGFLLCAFPWYLRNKLIGGNRYESQLTLKNPYQPELGVMKTADWFTRIEKNAKRYVSMEIPSVLLGYKIEKYNEPLPKDKKWFVGFLFIALGIIGFFCVREYKWLIFFYLSGTCAILLLWPDVWIGIRFILTVVPLIYMLIILAVFDGISWFSKKINIHEKIRVSFVPFIFLVFIFVQRDGITYLVNSAKGGMPPMYARYFELAKWAKTNIPSNSVVVCRKSELFYLYSGCKTTSYMYTLNADSLILNMKANKATHVVLDQLGFASTGRYLYPAIQKNPEKFKLLQHLQNPDTYLFEIHYDYGYKGEMKDGKRNGKGISRNADGTVYDGYWKNDIKEGNGIFTWPNGLKFEGLFSNNLRNGTGVMHMGNGQILKAIWTNDTINGYARLYNSDGKIIREGIMKNNNFVNGKP